MSRHRIGILGGMGALASAYAYRRCCEIAIERFSAREDKDFPEIVVYNLPLEDFDVKGFSDGDSIEIAKQLKLGLRVLQDSGVVKAVVACNTVHFFYKELYRDTNVELVSLIHSGVVSAILKELKTICVLSSETSKRLGLFSGALQELGFEEYTLENSVQELVDRIILGVMRGESVAILVNFLNDILVKISKTSAQCVILGCTELSVLFNMVDVPSNLVVVDSLESALVRLLSDYYS